MISFTTFASERHDHKRYPQETIETRIETKIEYRGIATAIANSQLNFGLGTKSLQGSCGYGNYNANNAITCGLGRRFGRVLVNGSIGSESGSDDYSYGIGAAWTF